MATFDKNKVICGANAEQAEIGKKYWLSDHIGYLKGHMEGNDDRFVHTLVHVRELKYGDSPFVDEKGHEWEFIYPYEDPPKKRMTNEEKAELAEEENNVGILFKKSYEELEKENAELKEQINQLKCENNILNTKNNYLVSQNVNYRAIINAKEEIIKQFYKQIEQMKCCENCKYKEMEHEFEVCHNCENCSNWSLKE